ncbi:MAG TPA: polyphosphate kinase 1 [Acidimicrobiales bacterium]
MSSLATTWQPPAAPPEPLLPIGADDELRFLNRELSRLDFHSRLLDLAHDGSVRMLERAKFLAIFSSNLDEFFQVQVANMQDLVAGGLGAPSPDGRSPAAQLHEIRSKVEQLIACQGGIFREELLADLAGAGIRLSEWGSLDDGDRSHLVDVFEHRIFPVLTPLSVDPAHPFPEISNLSLNLAVMVVNPHSGERRFARVKVPPLLPRFVVMPDGERFVPLEQVIAAHLPALFRGMEIESQFPFRVTRNADVMVEEEETDDLLEAMEIELRRRRFGKAVRLEVDARMTDEVRDLLLRELELEPEDLYAIEGPLDLSGLWAVYDLDRPDLKDDPWAPMTQPSLATPDGEPLELFGVLRERDVLVHHPYDSFTTSVEELIKQAAADPHVLAIKQTLYRTGGDSEIVQALIAAAVAGKQVVVLVELKARFDEERNIGWARQLEDAGVHVVYGVVGLKTHAKIALVVREEDDGIRRYCHVGTGNYNSRTARQYSDLGLLSADPAFGADLTELFNFLTGYSRSVDYERILVAPTSLRNDIIELIQAEARAGSDGRIVIKANHLVDPATIDALYDASRAGVDIDLVIRSICCLRPGVPGLSDHIRVRSIVGRYLEHSRIFSFGGRSGRALRMYIGSADLWQRNLDRRIEVVAPVHDPQLQAGLWEVLDVNLRDDTNAWELQPDGSWRRTEMTEGTSTFRQLQDAAMERARRRRDPESLAR